MKPLVCLKGVGVKGSRVGIAWALVPLPQHAQPASAHTRMIALVCRLRDKMNYLLSPLGLGCLCLAALSPNFCHSLCGRQGRSALLILNCWTVTVRCTTTPYDATWDSVCQCRILSSRLYMYLLYFFCHSFFQRQGEGRC